MVRAQSSQRGGRQVVVIAVTDQGIGIADADGDRISERCYRVDPARSRATGGTGIGFAIVKNITQNHSGSVQAWSSLGAGSTFTIRLPRVHADQSLSVRSAAAGAGQPTDVVVIDSAKRIGIHVGTAVGRKDV